jgi:hypothetical protein
MVRSCSLRPKIICHPIEEVSFIKPNEPEPVNRRCSIQQGQRPTIRWYAFYHFDLSAPYFFGRCAPDFRTHVFHAFPYVADFAKPVLIRTRVFLFSTTMTLCLIFLFLHAPFVFLLFFVRCRAKKKTKVLEVLALPGLSHRSHPYVPVHPTA